MNNQPEWKCIAQLGDSTPLEYGGAWILVDATGVYSPEMEIYDPETGSASRLILDQCTYVNGILGDNKFHPAHAAWFASPESEKDNRPQDTTYLSMVCDTVGCDFDDLVSRLCSPDPIARASGYLDLVSYHGEYEFDQYPAYYTPREAKKRYSRAMYKIK